MDLNRLRHIVAVARNQSFSRAAEEQGITQPALSRSIAAFERRHGVVLFDRGRGGVHPTAAGNLVIDQARKLLAAAGDLERSLRRHPAGEVGPFEDVPVESLARVVHVNVLGVVVPCQVIGAAMARAGRGSIVNVGSVYGLLSPDQSLYDFRRETGEAFFKPVAYSVSKSALLNLTRYLATYWGRSGVRVNTLTPHGIENGQPPPFVEAFAARSPLGRLMDVSEAVGAVVFLASDASSYVTGANLVVDGGWSAW